MIHVTHQCGDCGFLSVDLEAFRRHHDTLLHRNAVRAERDALFEGEVAPAGAAIAEQLERSLRADGFDVRVTFEDGASVLRDAEPKDLTLQPLDTSTR